MINPAGHNACFVANFILSNLDSRLTPLQINKLVYFSHGWMLGLYDRALITECVEAWKYGPVIPSIYHAFKSHGRDLIRFRDCFDELYKGLDESESSIVNQVMAEYGKMSGPELIDLTHEPDTPWDQYYDESKCNVVIPNEAIRDYFRNESKDDK